LEERDATEAPASRREFGSARVVTVCPAPP
jgi:hypothetical protein